MSHDATTAEVADTPLDSNLFAVFSDMSATESRTFWTCSAGWSLDALDIMMYSLLIVIISRQWGLSLGEAGFAATVTLMSSAAGGWAAGNISDRFGRVAVLRVTILWFAGFSLLSAFAANFHQLAVCRALLGFGFGGEWAAGAVLLGETIRPHLRGRAIGCMQAGWAVGWGGAVIEQAVLFSVLPAEIAWRAMFALGALPALVVFSTRRHLQEPPLAVAARRSARAGIFAIFRPPHLKITALAALLAAGAQGGYYAIALWLPSFLVVTRHLSIQGSASYLAVIISGSFAGYLAGAWLADKLGRRPLFFIFAIGAAATVVIYTKITFSNQALLILGFPLGFFSSGYYAGIGAFLTELFPTAIRGSGQGFTYNFGRGLGAIFPTLTGYLTASVGLGNAIAIFALSAYAILIMAAFWLPETRGRDLTIQAR
jgi:MFS family permease